MLCAGNDGRAAVFCLWIILRYFMEMKYNLRTAAFYIIIIQTYVLNAWLWCRPDITAWAPAAGDVWELFFTDTGE